MPVPTSYTELALAQYMHDQLGGIADVLGYARPVSFPDSYQEVVNEVLLELGVADISAVTDMRKLRVMARLYAWKKAAAALSSKYDFSTDGESYHRSQMHQQALKAVEDIMSECLALGLYGYSVEFQELDYRNDPYGYPKNLEV